MRIPEKYKNYKENIFHNIIQIKEKKRVLKKNRRDYIAGGMLLKVLAWAYLIYVFSLCLFNIPILRVSLGYVAIQTARVY